MHTTGRQMRIGTWNVGYALPRRLDALRAVLADNRADIWVLTETHDDLAPAGCPYVAHTHQRLQEARDVRPGSRWVSIWSVYPILERVVLEGADQKRTVITMLDIGSGDRMLVYGTVIPWQSDRGTNDWSEHHRVIPVQCDEWRTLRRRYPDAALCVAGDYNTDMQTGRFYGTRRGIADLSAGLADCSLFCATTLDRVPAGRLLDPPIDHIALPLDWQDRAKVIVAWPPNKSVLSDHSGLVVLIDG